MFVGSNITIIHKEKTIAKQKENKPWIIIIEGIKYSIMYLPETYFDPTENKEKQLDDLLITEEK